MKKLLALFILSISCLCLNGQSINDTIRFTFKENAIYTPFVNGAVEYSKIVNVDRQSADELYFNAQLCITDIFRSAKDAVQLDSKENKTIVVKANELWISANTSLERWFDVYYTVKIECRDNRYKMTVYGFTSKLTSRVGSDVLTIIVNESDCLKYGINKDNSLKSSFMGHAFLYGLSFLAWDQVANELFGSIQEKMTQDNSLGKSDW